MPPKKDVKADRFTEIGFAVLLLIILWYIWSTLLSSALFKDLGQSIKTIFLLYVWPLVIGVVIFLIGILIYGISRNFRKLKDLNKREKAIYHPSGESAKADVLVLNRNVRWENIIEHINSPNANDWRLAIIEADVMLDELLRKQGYHGESIGEMLKAVEKSDMLTLDLAWDAHKVRNQIAHGGTTFDLTEREAKRVIALYEQVFREFKII